MCCIVRLPALPDPHPSTRYRLYSCRPCSLPAHGARHAHSQACTASARPCSAQDHHCAHGAITPRRAPCRAARRRRAPPHPAPRRGAPRPRPAARPARPPWARRCPPSPPTRVSDQDQGSTLRRGAVRLRRLQHACDGGRRAGAVLARRAAHEHPQRQRRRAPLASGSPAAVRCSPLPLSVDRPDAAKGRRDPAQPRPSCWPGYMSPTLSAAAALPPPLHNGHAWSAAGGRQRPQC